MNIIDMPILASGLFPTNPGGKQPPRPEKIREKFRSERAT
jgi:hypothetical protein